MYGIYEGGKVIAAFTAPMTVRSNRPANISDTLSLKRFTSGSKAQRWEIESAFDPKSFDAQDLFVSIVVKGYTDPVDVLMPQNYGSLLKRTATGSASASGALGAATVSVTVAGLIPKGTFVTFGSSKKVYMTTTDCNGGGSVSIHPELQGSVSGAMQFKEDVVGSFYYDTSSVRGMVYKDGILMDLGTIKLVEAL